MRQFAYCFYCNLILETRYFDRTTSSRRQFILCSHQGQCLAYIAYLNCKNSYLHTLFYFFTSTKTLATKKFRVHQLFAPWPCAPLQARHCSASPSTLRQARFDKLTTALHFPLSNFPLSNFPLSNFPTF